MKTKNLVKLAIAALLISGMVGMASNVMAAQTNGDASATVVAPIEINQVNDLKMGSGLAGDTLTMAANGTVGGSSLAANGITQAGTFLTGGDANRAYTLSNGNASLLNGVIPVALTVVCSSTQLTGDTISCIGTTAALPATVGLYTGQYTVTVNYN